MSLHAHSRIAITLTLLGGVALTTPAQAFWGIGDVTFDPTAYGELVAHGKQLMDTYKTITDQLDRLDRMQHTIQAASEAYDRLSNVDLHAMAEGLNPGRYFKYANNDNGIRMMRAALGNMKASGQNDRAFINGQLSRIEDLESMAGLQAAAANNTEHASTDLDVRRSSQIAAQSTSVMAALASTEAQRRQQADMALSQERQQQSDLISESAKLYSTMKPASGSATR